MAQVYKLVFEGHSTDALGAYCLKYRVMETTCPAPGTDWVMAFDSLESARGYSAGGDVWRCEAELVDERPKHVCMDQDAHNLRKWWGMDLGYRYRGATKPWNSMVFCKWIKPIELVSMGPAKEDNDEYDPEDFEEVDDEPTPNGPFDA